MSGPKYKFEELVKACENNPAGVYIPNEVVEDARRDFDLNSAKAIKDFIAQGGLEEIDYKKTDPWENNPKKDVCVIWVDVYHFYSGEIYGYLAFFNNTITDKWHIKSFKKNDQFGSRSSRDLKRNLFSGVNIADFQKKLSKGDLNE